MLSNTAAPAPEADCAIEIHDLWRIYSPGTRQEVQALRGIDLKVAEGSFLALKGRSGSGQDHPDQLHWRVDRPTRGTVRVFGEEPYKLR